MTPWQEIVNFLGGATLFAALFGYLGRKAIEAYLAGRVESYKSNLEKIANEHAIRFRSLHSERAEIIKVFYEKLSVVDETLHSTLRSFQVVGERTLEEKVSDLSDQFNDLRNYYLPKRIFFEQNICEQIEAILDRVKGVFYDITTLPVNPTAADYRYNRELLQERHEFWDNARNMHRDEISQLKGDLENEFRTILGINS